MAFFTRDTPSPVLGGGQRRALASPYSAPRPIIASARPLLSGSIHKKTEVKGWQREAWNGYNNIGEIHYGFNLLAETFSRIKVYAGALLDSAEVPVPVADLKEDVIGQRLARKAEDIVTELANTDFSSAARTFALNMSVSGECLLLQMPAEGADAGEGKPDQWVVKSTTEVLVSRDKISLKPSGEDGSGEAVVLSRRINGKWTPEIPIGRIWRRHPQHSDDADSSMRALKDPIDELLLVSKLIRTITRARLNAGVVFLPDGVALAGAGSSEEDVNDGGGFIQDLIDTMIQPINDEDSVTSVVPSVLTGPAELGEKIRHITFDRTSDEWLTTRADRALERVLQGIAIPKDLVTGLSNVKYSNAIVIDQNFWKSSVEPMALLFSDALTDIYLRPRLIEAGFTQQEADRVCVWYDPSEIVTKPDQSDDASSGFDKYLLSGKAWRRVHGFPESDAPSEEELALQLLFSKGNIQEDVVATLLKIALPKIMQDANEKASEGRVPPSAQDILNQTSPVRENPDNVEEEVEPATPPA